MKSAAAHPSATVLCARRVEKNSLRGFFDLRLPSGLVLRSCSLHLSHGRWWVGLPAISYVKQDGAKAWSPTVDFTDGRTRRRFQEVAFAALVVSGTFPEIADSRREEHSSTGAQRLTTGSPVNARQLASKTGETTLAASRVKAAPERSMREDGAALVASAAPLPLFTTTEPEGALNDDIPF